MNKHEMILSLRSMIEQANRADVDERPLRGGLSVHHAHDLYGHLQAALISLGDGPAHEHWSRTNEWPYRSPDTEAVHFLLKTLDAEGWKIIKIDDGGEVFVEPDNPITDPAGIILSVDSSDVVIRHRDGEVATLMIVLGNAPWELVADYGASAKDFPTVEIKLDSILDKLEAEFDPDTL